MLVGERNTRLLHTIHRRGTGGGPYGGGRTVVGGQTAVNGSARIPSDPGVDPDTSSLPVTGGDIAGLAALGAGAVGIGAFVEPRASGTARSDRRRPRDAAARSVG